MKHPLLFLLCAFGQWCHSLGLVPRSWDFRSYLGTLGLFARTLGLFLGLFFEKFKCDFLKMCKKKPVLEDKNVTERRNFQNFSPKKEKFQAVPDTGDFLGLFWVPTWDFSKK